MNTPTVSPLLRRMTLAAAVLGLTACAGMGGGSSPAMMRNGMLVGANDMTLYTFDKDAGGKSMCNGKCAENWPPLKAASMDAMGGYTVIKRDDGSLQYAYKGKPLYYWIKDQKAGDTTGEGVNGVWHVAH